jgi:TolB-like protein
MQKVWPDTFVEEAGLTRNISSLRKVLGERLNEAHYIETIPKRGYRFIASVKEFREQEAELVVERHARTEILTEEEEEISSPGQTDRGIERKSLRASSLKERVAEWKLRPTSMTISLALVVLACFAYFWISNRAKETQISVGVRSIAVLPLENLSGDPSQEYFADGMTDVLITDLAKIGALRVISRQAVMKYKGTRQSPSDIARELNVDALVGGAVLRSGDRVRITAQLIHPATERHLWAESYERDVRDVLGLQREMVRAIVGEIRVKVSASEQTHLAKALKVNPEAYLYYLRGKALDVHNNKADNLAAIELLERAVTVDPAFAAAQARLAVAYVDRYFYFAPEDQKRWEEKAHAAVEKALSLDPDLADAYLARGRLLWTPSNRFPHEKAIRELRRAIALNPNSDDARGELALILNHIGLNDEGLREAQAADAINPSAKRPLFQIGYALLWQGKYEQGLPVLRGIPKEFNPGSAGSFIAWALFQLGRRDEAMTKLEEYSKEYPQDTGGRFAAVEALLLAAAGEERKALDKIQSATEKKDFGHFHHTAHFIASAYARMNKPKEAAYWLQQAAENGFPCYPLFEQDSNLDPIRQDPRFIAFMAKLKAQWEQYKATLSIGS